MSDAKLLLERQARWQKARKAMTWPEKVRMAEGVRESVQQLRTPAVGGAGRPRQNTLVKTTPKAS